MLKCLGEMGGLAPRIEALQQWKQAVLSHKDELLKALVSDTGRLSYPCWKLTPSSPALIAGAD
jgi:hypothetical protein